MCFGGVQNLAHNVQEDTESFEVGVRRRFRRRNSRRDTTPPGMCVRDVRGSSCARHAGSGIREGVRAASMARTTRGVDSIPRAPNVVAQVGDDVRGNWLEGAQHAAGDTRALGAISAHRRTGKGFPECGSVAQHARAHAGGANVVSGEEAAISVGVIDGAVWVGEGGLAPGEGSVGTSPVSGRASRRMVEFRYLEVERCCNGNEVEDDAIRRMAARSSV
ncbi:hypothetical protein DFH09DRAFT_1067846 [Mycena vulgaris]|nr:hypothetical protein DFH09DRAFT_1067846 [Mycena vulgaris]